MNAELTQSLAQNPGPVGRGLLVYLVKAQARNSGSDLCTTQPYTEPFWAVNSRLTNGDHFNQSDQIGRFFRLQQFFKITYVCNQPKCSGANPTVSEFTTTTPAL
jgi:hypothetical protein